MINSPVGDDTSYAPAYDPNYELEWQIQIGGKSYPSDPVRSVAESFTHFVKALNYPNKYQHSSNIDAISWRSTKFFMTYDFEKMKDASFAGIDASCGDLMIIRAKASPLESSATSCVLTSGTGDNIFVLLVADNILNIADSGTTVEG